MSFEIDDNGSLVWTNEKGELHREKGPAMIWSRGPKNYFLDGELHREDGPSIIYPNGDKYYYLYGRFYFKGDYWNMIRSKVK